MEKLRLKLWLIVVLLFLLGHGTTSKAVPVGTAFTYQGRLTDGNQPAEGFYDFQFKLFDGPTGSNQIGSTVGIYDVDVNNGYFTVELDFGSGVFDGEARWLEIALRPAPVQLAENVQTYPLAAEPEPQPLIYTILSPRQKITPTPYALYALSASSGTAPAATVGGSGTDNYIPRWIGTDSLENSVIYQTDTGNVGIGTTVPSGKLEVKSSNYANYIFTDSSTSGYTTTFNMDNTGLKIGHSSPFRDFEFRTNSATRMTIDSSGKVGIGTTIPQTVFDVHGGRIRASQGFESIYGTSAVVSIGFINDNDTGMFSPEENSVAFSTNGIERLTIDASGNVGIGTTSPGAKLGVNGQIKITGGSPGTGKVLTSDASGLATWQTISGGGAGDNLGNHTATQNIKLNGYWLSGDGGNEGVYVTTSGYVGIGIHVPKQKFEVSQGSIILSEPNSTMRYISLQRNGGEVGSLSTANGRITVGAASGFDAMVQNSSAAGIIVKNSSGNVGIGMTDPSEKLDVIGTARLRGLTASSGTNVVADTNGKLYRQSSSRRYKTNIQSLEDDADKVLELRPVRFQWKTTWQEEIGLIAEEVEGIARDLVIYDQEGKADGVKYEKVSLYLLKVVKDLKSENESLKQKLDTLEKKIENIERHDSSVAREVQQ